MSESCAPTSDEESSDEEHFEVDNERCDEGEKSDNDKSDTCNENDEFSEDQEELKSLNNVDDGEETGEAMSDDERTCVNQHYRNENTKESIES